LGAGVPHLAGSVDGAGDAELGGEVKLFVVNKELVSSWSVVGQ
jgi:hypothetical protein